MEYTIVQSASKEEFVAQVSQHLQEGWQLHGSPSVSPVVRDKSFFYSYVQAMTKGATDEDRGVTVFRREGA